MLQLRAQIDGEKYIPKPVWIQLLLSVDQQLQSGNQRILMLLFTFGTAITDSVEREQRGAKAIKAMSDYSNV
jgi:hypothetical protein